MIRLSANSFVVNADFATKAVVNMVFLDLIMAVALRPHTKGSIGLAYSLLPSQKRVNRKAERSRRARSYGRP